MKPLNCTKRNATNFKSSLCAKDTHSKLPLLELVKVYFLLSVLFMPFNPFRPKQQPYHPLSRIYHNEGVF